jgi:hypothetical protein
VDGLGWSARISSRRLEALAPEMTGERMVGLADLDELRDDRRADFGIAELGPELAARMEPAATGRVDR